MLGTTQPRLHHIVNALDVLGPEVEVEHTILRAFVDDSDRADLVHQLSAWPYTCARHAEYPAGGSLPGTWGVVEDAHVHGLLSGGEFERIKAAVRPLSDA